MFLTELQHAIVNALTGCRQRRIRAAAERRLEGREHLPQSGERPWPDGVGASSRVLSEHAAAEGGEHGEGAGAHHDHQGRRPTQEVRHRARGRAEGAILGMRTLGISEIQKELLS